MSFRNFHEIFNGKNITSTSLICKQQEFYDLRIITVNCPEKDILLRNKWKFRSSSRNLHR